MVSFSGRNGLIPDGMELEQTSQTLRKRIFARFYKQEYSYYNVSDFSNYTTGIEDMMIEMGVQYEFPKNEIIRQKNAEALEDEVVYSDEWYVIFDFIEGYLRMCDGKKLHLMTDEFNRILEDEVSAYRIVDKIVVPITNNAEIETIRTAMNTKYDAINTHMAKALELYADRRKPDYENSIKESISAVESTCCLITGQSGTNATLGRTIKKLKDHGIHIHSALESAFSSLYGYTSDENGIRHGGIDYQSAPAEDAKYMLVSCSAFVNYLIEKWSKVSSV